MASEIYACLDWLKFEERNYYESEKFSRMLMRLDRLHDDYIQTEENQKQSEYQNMNCLMAHEC
jgi:hypothetical protein